MSDPPPKAAQISVAQKLRSKQLAHQRFGSPKLRDLLREKCRIRLRESRTGTFDEQRGSFDSDDEHRRALFGAAINDELRELNVDLALQERLAEELSEEALAEFLDDLLQQEAAFIEQLDGNGDAISADTAVPFFCPICQVDVLQPVLADHHRCERCALRFKSAGAQHQLQYELLRQLVQHERSGCEAAVTFFAEPIAGSEFSSLNMFCGECDFYATFRPK